MARPRLSTFGPRRAGALAVLALGYLSGCGGDVVNLASSGTMLGGSDAGMGGAAGSGGAMAQGGAANVSEWHSPKLVLPYPADEEVSFANGTLTGDASRLYLSRQLRGNPETTLSWSDVSGGAWSAPIALVIDAFDAKDATSPAISLDGNQLWFGSRWGDAPSTEIWLTTRTGDTWSEPEKVEALSSDFDDAPRQPAVDNTIMPLSSRRGGSKYHQVWFATRASATDPWQTVTQNGLAPINSPDFESTDAFLTEDGLTLFFSSTRSGNGDSFRTRRASLGDSFGEPVALEGVNSSAYEERDPWLDKTTQRLYFTSSHSGIYEIYVAEHTP